MTPAERLLAAADLLEKRAGEASTGPWIEAGIGEFGWSVIGGDFPLTSSFAIETDDSEQGKADATYIATMHPEVGKAVAKVLHEEARRVSLGWGWTQEALALADLLLAGAS